MENIADLFAHVDHLTQHIEHMKTKPRREDAITIRNLKAQLKKRATFDRSGLSKQDYEDMQKLLGTTKS